MRLKSLKYFIKNPEGEKELIIRISSSVDKMLRKTSLNASGGIELLSVLGLDALEQIPPEAYRRKVFTAYASGRKLFIFRLYFHTSENVNRLKADISMVANELLHFKQMKNKDVALDFIFTGKGHLIGIIPVPFFSDNEEESLAQLKTPQMKHRLREISIFYYDCGELWLDLKQIQNSSHRRLSYIKKYKRERKQIRDLFSSYMKSVYSQNAEVINPYGKTVYVYERKRDNGWSFMHFSLDELESCIIDGKLGGNDILDEGIFAALPGTYVPGKYIDIGYYDAIDGNDINLNGNDIIFVIGFGSGLDLIHSLRHAGSAFAIEVNPFGVASAKANLKVLGWHGRAEIVWNDFRELVEGVIKMPTEYHGRITKLLWNIPYESLKSIENPLELKDYFDNYSLLDWFVPFLSKSSMFATGWRALFWKIADGSSDMEEYFTKYGFKALPNDDENICVVFPNPN